MNTYSVWFESTSLRQYWIHQMNIITKLGYNYGSIFCLVRKCFTKTVLDSPNQSYHQVRLLVLINILSGSKAFHYDSI